MSGWLFLMGAILMEVAGTTCLKNSQQFTNVGSSMLMFVFYGLSLAGLSFALKSIDLSIAYAVWSALGITLVSIIGIVWFHEPVSAMKIVCLLLVGAGVVGLQLSSLLNPKPAAQPEGASVSGASIEPASTPQTAAVAPDERAAADGRIELRLLSVLMPIYNERGTLAEIIGRVFASPVGVAIELIAVDDGSDDGSWELLERLASDEPRLQAIRQPHNIGKGAAVRLALQAARGEIAIVQDADLEYDPAEYPRLLAPLLAGDADAVFGSRFAAGGARDDRLPKLARESLAHLARQSSDRTQPHRYGNRLQSGPHGPA